MAHLEGSNVVDWSARPRRTIRKPLSYWEEFVQKDTWYLAKLLEDVPPEEMHAACVDDDFTGDMEECGEESEVDIEINEDELAVLLDFLDEDEGEDTEYVPAAEEGESSSDEEEESIDASEEDGESGDDGDDATNTGDGEEEEVHGSSEGE